MTNGDKFDEGGVEEQAKSAGIKIMKATLSSGWEGRVDWKVTEMNEVKMKPSSHNESSSADNGIG